MTTQIEGAEAGTIELDAIAADEVLAAAERRLAVAERVLQKAELGLQEANTNRAAAKGEGFKPIYKEGIARRLRAAEQADRARALLAKAESDYQEATELLNHATRNGTPHVVYDQGHNHTLGTLAEETARWSRPNGWWNGQLIEAE